MAVMLSLTTELFAQTTNTTEDIPLNPFPDGYYRIYNFKTGRHATLVDGKGSLVVNGTSFKYDLGALKLKDSFDDVVDDPGAIIKFTYDDTGTKTQLRVYYMQAQCVNTKDIINRAMKLWEGNIEEGYYVPYAKEGVAMGYLCDNNGQFAPVANAAKAINRFWYIKPVKNESGDYFGVKPTMQAGGKYYTTLYAEFPFQLSSGVKAYYVNAVNSDGSVNLVEIKNKVPEATPVILECNSQNAVDNKLLPLMETVPAVSGNLLKGVYFCMYEKIRTYSHYNRTKFDATTMRVLNVADGKITFGKNTSGNVTFSNTSSTFIPHNTAYLDISSVTDKKDSYEMYTSGISDVKIDPSTDSRIYDLHGRVVENPARGIYIRNGKKFVVK